MTAPRRQFTMLDAMVLVAATAAGCALSRSAWASIVRAIDGRMFVYLVGGAILAGCFLSPWSLALLILRLRAPRPARRMIRRQPGLLASLAVVSVWVLYGCLATWDRVRRITEWSSVHLMRYSASMPMELDGVVDGVTEITGWIVAAAWITLVIAGACRPEPSWIDRAGRILGACWIAIAVLMTFLLL